MSLHRCGRELPLRVLHLLHLVGLLRLGPDRGDKGLLYTTITSTSCSLFPQLAPVKFLSSCPHLFALFCVLLRLCVKKFAFISAIRGLKFHPCWPKPTLPPCPLRLGPSIIYVASDPNLPE